MQKEKLKFNEVPNTLFVGMGGVGSDVIKQVAELCRGTESENISFVCLDTNVNDLRSIKKSGKKIYSIQTSSTQTVGSYLDYDKDALNNWFPKNAVMYDKSVSEGAGQVRAISRLSFNAAVKMGRLRALYDAIDELFRKDGGEMKQAMRVVIVASASGGTGSGIILPLSMFIRNYMKNKYPNTCVVMRGLLLLPEVLDSVIHSEVERESQRRNAYATVKELNAFMMKGSGFFEVDPDLKRYSGIHLDFTEQGSDSLYSLSLLPFDFCFLFDGQDAEDNTMVNLSQYKKQAALALYEQNIGPMQKLAYSVEDNIVKEISKPGNYGRNRFGGIGAGILRYPYDDIVDYIAYQWAIDRIGGDGDAAKWGKYDKLFAIKAAEARKKGLSLSEMPKIREEYTSAINERNDAFSKDLRNMYLQDADTQIEDYILALEGAMQQCLNDNAAIRGTQIGAQLLKKPLSYEDESNRGNADVNLNRLRAFETAVKAGIVKTATSKAEGIFHNEIKTINADTNAEAYTIEKLFTHPINGAVHPNAMRYLLYLLDAKFEEKIEEKRALVTKLERGLAGYSQGADRVDLFDATYTRKDSEKTIDALCAAEKGDPSILERMMGSESVYEKLNDVFPKYYSLIYDYGVAKAQAVAYEYGLDYVHALSKHFCAFYATFSDKVKALSRKQEDLVNALVFNKGDSVLNVCCSEPILKELAQSATNATDGLMLPKELNAKIFDAVKANVIFERESANESAIVEDRRIDIFDAILTDYFRDAVREQCTDTLDLNIIEAIGMEYRLKSRIKAREEINAEERIFDKVSHDDTLRYIVDTIGRGRRLSAPGIQRMAYVEPREVVCNTYNKDLLNMRQYKMHELVEGSEPSDTVSKYELRFFNAIYNITPDKLSKFACEQSTETGTRAAGLYHKAYTTYSHDIGPDSTKNAIISTHIDKRWDSIAVMPELDLGYQNRMVMTIHQAMIYGLIYRAIQHRNLSTSEVKKKIYRYEDSQEHLTELIVSNGTLCDEFYEILDSLYISASIVKDIYRIKETRSKCDEVKHSNYDASHFAKQVAEFYIDDLHDGETSLFEIPLYYYNSLPNSKRFIGEITSLVDAVINTLYDELRARERPQDAKFRLCDLLCENFDLLMNNYDEFKKLGNGISAIDNPVIDIIYRRIRNIFETTPEPDDYESCIANMRERIKASQPNNR